MISRRWIALFLAAAFFSLCTACAVTVEQQKSEEETASGELEQDEEGEGEPGDSKACKDRCMEEFHACKDSPGKGPGPGASGCAHQKNECMEDC